MTETITGGCLCKACRFETNAQPINIRACHCSRCQKAVGASFNARVLVPLDQLRIEGEVQWYASSPELRRGFCPVCGTTMFSERAAANVIGLTMGSLDQPDRFQPSEHIWVSAKQKWLVLEDGLAQYAESCV